MSKDDSLNDEQLDTVCGGVSVANSNLSVVTETSGHVVTGAGPNACLIPAGPAPFIPVASPGGTASATGPKGAGVAVAVKGSSLSPTNGDEPGALMGMVSPKI